MRRLGARVAKRLGKMARHYLAERDEQYVDPDDEQAAVDHAPDTALRPPVRPQASLWGSTSPGPRPEKPLCANIAGFSLHAARTVAAHDREGLERLCRYGLRVPFAQHRLSEQPVGRGARRVFNLHTSVQSSYNRAACPNIKINCFF